MSNVLLDQGLPTTTVQDMKKTVRQAGQEQSADPYTVSSQTVFLPTIYSDLMFDQKNISTTRNLVQRWELTPSISGVNGTIYEVKIDSSWVFDNINRFKVSRDFNVYNDYILCLELMLNGSPQTWGSIFSAFCPHGFNLFEPLDYLSTLEILNTQQYMIQPLHVNSKRTWMIPTDKPFDHFRNSDGHPDTFILGTFTIRVLNTIRSTSTTTSSPELQLWASASMTYGGTIYNGSVAI